jgi:hypothetical protein
MHRDYQRPRSLKAATVQQGQLLRPYPQYNGLSYAGAGIGNSTYESLQVKAEKRFAGGASLLVAYTHAKPISDTDTITGWLESGARAATRIGTTYVPTNRLPHSIRLTV